jgi:hypothetical protein
VGLEGIDPEGLDAEKAAHVVRPAVRMLEPRPRLRPALENVRRPFGHRLPVLVA